MTKKTTKSNTKLNQNAKSKAKSVLAVKNGKSDIKSSLKLQLGNNRSKLNNNKSSINQPRVSKLDQNKTMTASNSQGSLVTKSKNSMLNKKSKIKLGLSSKLNNNSKSKTQLSKAKSGLKVNQSKLKLASKLNSKSKLSAETKSLKRSKSKLGSKHSKVKVHAADAKSSLGVSKTKNISNVADNSKIRLSKVSGKQSSQISTTGLKSKVRLKEEKISSQTSSMLFPTVSSSKNYSKGVENKIYSQTSKIKSFYGSTSKIQSSVGRKSTLGLKSKILNKHKSKGTGGHKLGNMSNLASKSKLMPIQSMVRQKKAQSKEISDRNKQLSEKIQDLSTSLNKSNIPSKEQSSNKKIKVISKVYKRKMHIKKVAKSTVGDKSTKSLLAISKSSFVSMDQKPKLIKKSTSLSKVSDSEQSALVAKLMGPELSDKSLQKCVKAPLEKGQIELSEKLAKEQSAKPSKELLKDLPKESLEKPSKELSKNQPKEPSEKAPKESIEKPTPAVEEDAIKPNLDSSLDSDINKEWEYVWEEVNIPEYEYVYEYEYIDEDSLFMYKADEIIRVDEPCKSGTNEKETEKVSQPKLTDNESKVPAKIDDLNKFEIFDTIDLPLTNKPNSNNNPIPVVPVSATTTTTTPDTPTATIATPTTTDNKEDKGSDMQKLIDNLANMKKSLTNLPKSLSQKFRLSKLEPSDYLKKSTMSPVVDPKFSDFKPQSKSPENKIDTDLSKKSPSNKENAPLVIKVKSQKFDAIQPSDPLGSGIESNTSPKSIKNSPDEFKVKSQKFDINKSGVEDSVSARKSIKSQPMSSIVAGSVIKSKSQIFRSSDNAKSSVKSDGEKSSKASPSASVKENNLAGPKSVEDKPKLETSDVIKSTEGGKTTQESDKDSASISKENDNLSKDNVKSLPNSNDSPTVNKVPIENSSLQNPQINSKILDSATKSKSQVFDVTLSNDADKTLDGTKDNKPPMVTTGLAAEDKDDKSPIDNYTILKANETKTVPPKSPEQNLITPQVGENLAMKENVPNEKLPDTSSPVEAVKVDVQAKDQNDAKQLTNVSGRTNDDPKSPSESNTQPKSIETKKVDQPENAPNLPPSSLHNKSDDNCDLSLDPSCSNKTTTDQSKQVTPETKASPPKTSSPSGPVTDRAKEPVKDSPKSPPDANQLVKIKSSIHKFRLPKLPDFLIPKNFQHQGTPPSSPKAPATTASPTELPKVSSTPASPTGSPKVSPTPSLPTESPKVSPIEAKPTSPTVQAIEPVSDIKSTPTSPSNDVAKSPLSTRKNQMSKSPQMKPASRSPKNRLSPKSPLLKYHQQNKNPQLDNQDNFLSPATTAAGLVNKLRSFKVHSPKATNTGKSTQKSVQPNTMLPVGGGAKSPIKFFKQTKIGAAGAANVLTSKKSKISLPPVRRKTHK